MTKKIIDVARFPTEEQKEMLEKAKNMPLPEGAEYPELSAEELRQFKRISDIEQIARDNIASLEEWKSKRKFGVKGLSRSVCEQN